MLNLDDHSHKEFHYGYTEEDADQDMVDCFCGKPFFPSDTGYDKCCSLACYADYVEGLEEAGVECVNCCESAGEGLYSMGYAFCSASCLTEAEQLMLGVYERIEEIDGMLIEQM